MTDSYIRPFWARPTVVVGRPPSSHVMVKEADYDDSSNRDRDVWNCQLWVMGGTLSLLTTATVQAKRIRRRELQAKQRADEEDRADRELLKGPDTKAKDFTPRNAFFFAHLSWLAYRDEDECRARFAALGLREFYWFARDEEAAESVFDEIMDTQSAVGACSKFIVVVFRGTKEGVDWLTNLKFMQQDFPGLSKVHVGFSQGVDTVWDGEGWMADTIHRLYRQRPRPIYVAGHSLGAALATIAAARIAVHFNYRVGAVYTMGSPRVFDAEGAKMFDDYVNFGKKMSQKCFRTVNNNDIVPCVPPALFDIKGLNYEHVGTQIYINRTGEIGAGTFWEHVKGHMEAVWQGVCLDMVNDHDIGKYSQAYHRALKLTEEKGGMVKAFFSNVSSLFTRTFGFGSNDGDDEEEDDDDEDESDEEEKSALSD